MTQLPNFHIEPPVKWLKNIEKLDTSVFPICHSIEREWKTRKGLSVKKHISYVHHSDECKWSILVIGIDEGKVDIKSFSV